jgi:excisionase family DNA binding protein
MTLPDKELLRPDEVAEYFSVSVQTVINWCERGKLKEVRTPGGHRRILRESVKDEYFSNRQL